MRKNYRGSKLLAALLVLVMLLCSFPLVYAEDAAAEIAVSDQEYTPETETEYAKDEAETAADVELEEVPEEEPEMDPELVETPEEAPAAEPDSVEIPEETPEEAEAETETEHEEAEIEEDAEEESDAETEADDDEEASEDELYEFDDDEVGSVSEELLEIFNNPDTYEKIEFTSTVEIELKNSILRYDEDVTLVARVFGADMEYRLVWEANDGNGWFAVASGHEYTFLLTPDIVNREYRVVLFRVC